MDAAQLSENELIVLLSQDLMREYTLKMATKIKAADVYSYFARQVNMQGLMIHQDLFREKTKESILDLLTKQCGVED